MPKISHHWVRLSEQDLHYILDGMPEQEEDTPEEYAQRLAAFAAKVGDLVEDGLETW
jgi:hypothetical protein